MPRKPTSLRDPRVVLAVVVLLLVVAAVNIQTFLPLHRLGQGTAGSGIETFSPPADAAEFKRIATAHVTGVATPEVMPTADELPSESPPANRSAGVAAARRAAEPHDSDEPHPHDLYESAADASLPSCTAILRAGAQPVALIDGVRRQVGDAFGDWEVTAISVEGASLQGPAGAFFLPVGRHDNPSSKFSLVTKTEAALGAGDTALQPQADSREP